MRLLLAEDEQDLSRALCAILKHNGYTVDPVYDGLIAMKHLDANRYDIVILDIMMPGADGIRVLKHFREKDAATPVIMLTAKAEIDDRVLGLDSGANDYLTKPFDAKELLARLRALLRTPSASGTPDAGQNTASSEELHLGNLTLNKASGTLSTPSASMSLANKEFQMMEIFLANANRLVSAEQIFEKVWGYDSDTDISVVWVYISTLRKKLASLSADVRIRAARGLGYVMEEAK